MTGQTRRPREHVLFATIEAGGGHLATARAMQAAVSALRPGLVTRVSDYMLELGLTEQDRRHKELWRKLLARPWLVRSGQGMLDLLPAATRAWHRRSLQEFARRAAEDLNRAGTQLVVANHGWLATGLTLARESYGLASSVLVFATEPLDASALWSVPGAEHVIAPSHAARRDLVRLGVPAKRVSTVGYPVGPAFLVPAPLREDDGQFRVLVSLGGEGVGADPAALLGALTASGWHATVLCGRNRALLQELRVHEAAGGLLKALGYTDDVPALIASSDAVIGKAGPASTLEALALGRPYVATAYAGLNEQKLVSFLAAQCTGGFARNPGELLRLLGPYAQSREARAAVRDRCVTLDFPGMTARVGQAIVAWLETRSIPDALKDRGLDHASERRRNRRPAS